MFEVAFKLEYKCECMKVGAGTRRRALPLLNVLGRKKQTKKMSEVHLPHVLRSYYVGSSALSAVKTQRRQDRVPAHQSLQSGR